MSTTRYKTRPQEVEAFRFNGPDSIPESFSKYVESSGLYGQLYVYTRFGTLYAKHGAWIVRSGGDVRVMSDAAFREEYEAVEEGC